MVVGGAAGPVDGFYLWFGLFTPTWLWVWIGPPPTPRLWLVAVGGMRVCLGHYMGPGHGFRVYWIIYWRLYWGSSAGAAPGGGLGPMDWGEYCQEFGEKIVEGPYRG